LSVPHSKANSSSGDITFNENRINNDSAKHVGENDVTVDEKENDILRKDNAKDLTPDIATTNDTIK